MSYNNDFSKDMEDLLWPRKPVEQLEESFDAPVSLTDEERSALKEYISGPALSMNRKLRKGEDKQNSALDRAIEKQPAKDYEVWRGASSKEQPGIHDPAYKSTSPYRDLAEEFALAGDEVIFHVTAPNMKAIEIIPGDWEENPWKSPYYETLFGRGTTMTEKKRYKDKDGKTIIDVELGYK